MNKPVTDNGFGPVSRRAFLSGAGALIVAASLPAGPRVARAATGDFAPNAFIRISGDGTITLIMRDVEMGQGIWTGASMLLAEELEVGLDQVTPEFALPDEKLYASPLLQTQATGGSTSMRGDWEEFRKIAAVTRAVLVEAAARQWAVEPGGCTVERGVVHHAPSGRSASYGSLAALAATFVLDPLPKGVSLISGRTATVEIDAKPETPQPLLSRVWQWVSQRRADAKGS